ncbi:fungal hydrophobin [Pluteus cervinus]|uniref:Fungal hydrophobin n=1 Tax=Pluteus cervinus TaxID=181527 RepID=A0ACD3B0V7_9AGAR|nr:fungal hydrophobin [Pluteus cervinus]
MFSRITVALPVVALASLAMASDVVSRNDGDCNTGSIQCCANTQTLTTTLASLLEGGGLLGLSADVLLPNIGALIGASCSPISALGLGGNSCSQQSVCCTNNSFGGLIALGCSPVNINV